MKKSDFMEQELVEKTQMIIAYQREHSPHGIILSCPDGETKKSLDGDYIVDEDWDNDWKGTELFTESGIFLCEIEHWFEQGYFEGYKEDGESEWWFAIKSVRKLYDFSEIKLNVEKGTIAKCILTGEVYEKQS